MSTGAVRSLHRYPIKSLMGEDMGEVEITEGGLPGDRCWAVRDEERGGIRGAKRFADLMKLHARFPEPPKRSGSSPAVITFEDGSEIATGDTDVNDRLSEYLGSPVTLWPLVSADQLEHYRRGAPEHEDLETEFRSILGREPNEPLPDVSRFPPEVLEFASPPGTYFDAFPLLLLSTRSLESLQDHASDSRIDRRRFRPNVLFDWSGTDDEPFPEHQWSGRRVKIGSAVLKAEQPCMRCVMITHDFADLPRDPRIMRQVVQQTDGHLGIYASIEQPGTVRVGDTIEVLD